VVVGTAGGISGIVEVRAGGPGSGAVLVVLETRV